MKISSNKVNVPLDAGSLFDFLEDMQNYKQLMPEQITNWEATRDHCRFTIPGMTDIGMKIMQSTRNSLIHIHSDGKVPFEFDLHFKVKQANDQQEVFIEFDGALSDMLAMMAKRPLQNLIDHMIDQLRNQFA